MEPSRADREAVIASVEHKFMYLGWREVSNYWMVVVMDGRYYNMALPKALQRAYRNDPDADPTGVTNWLLGKRIAFCSAVEQRGETFYVRRPTKVRVL